MSPSNTVTKAPRSGRQKKTVSSRPHITTPQSVAEQVYDYVVDCINSSILKPRERITEANVARELGVSHVPVREAFMRLEEHFWITRSANKGNFVSSFDDDALRQAYQFRQILETGAIRITAKTITKKQLAELKKVVDILTYAFENENALIFEEANKQFHCLLVSFAKNQRLERTFQTLLSQFFCFRFLRKKTGTISELDNHLAIYEGLVNHDVETAVAALTNDIAGGYDQIMNFPDE